jgi:hypothetical protein
MFFSWRLLLFIIYFTLASHKTTLKDSAGWLSYKGEGPKELPLPLCAMLGPLAFTRDTCWSQNYKQSLSS